MAAPPPTGFSPGRFLRSFFSALTDEKTYDLRSNPSLWLGFLLALPHPIVALASDGPAWLVGLACLSPIVWAAILGAAGRLHAQAESETRRVLDVADRMRAHLDQTEEALGEEVLRRQALEEEQEAVISDLKLAEAVHRTLAPETFVRTEVEVAAKVLPSRLLGGDYVHTNVVEDRWLYVYVADVSGHGVSAALVVARLHGVVRRLTLTQEPCETILERINRAALQILKHTYFFMTCVIVRLDLHTGQMTYATAGHPAQILLRQDGKLEPLRTRNRLLGMDADIFDEQEPIKSVQLERGDMLVLFTDGLFEVLKDGSGDVLGETGLQRRVEKIGPLEPSLLLGEILQDLSEYTGRTQFDDDVALCVARYLGPPALPEPPTDR